MGVFPGRGSPLLLTLIILVFAVVQQRVTAGRSEES